MRWNLKNLIGQTVLNVDQIVHAETSFRGAEEPSAFDDSKKAIVAHNLTHAKFKVGQFVDFKNRAGVWVEGQIQKKRQYEKSAGAMLDDAFSGTDSEEENLMELEVHLQSQEQNWVPEND